MSTKNKVLVILALIFLLLIPSTAALAKNEPVYVSPFGGDFTVTSRDQVVIRYGWVACSKGLVNDYIDSVNHLFFLDGELIRKAQAQDKSYWSAPNEYELDDIPSSICLWDVDKVWVAYWEYSLGRLEPGDYELALERTFAFPVIDGTGYNGELHTYQGFVRFPATTIHVTP